MVGGCGGKKDDGNTGVVNPNKPSPKAVPVNIDNPILEKAIRRPFGGGINKPTGELTKADYEKVTKLDFYKKQLTDVTGLENLTQLEVLDLNVNQLTNVKGLEKLTQLKELSLHSNYDLTKAQITELQKALPNCLIWSNPKK